MKKDQNLPHKNIHSNNSSRKPLPGNSNFSRNQSPFNSSYRDRSPEQRNSQNFSQNRYRRSNSQNNQNRNNYSRSNSNRTEFVSASSSHSNPRNRHYSNNRSRNSSNNRIRNYSNKRNRSHSKNRINIIKDLVIITKIDQETIHKMETQAITIDKEIIPNLLTGIITAIQIHNIDIEVTHQSIKDKLVKQITEESTSDPPGTDDIGNTELQLNHINCESTDNESDTNNTISVIMIAVKNDYEPIIYEQPFSSHIYENQLELLQDYYTRHNNHNIPKTKEGNEINTVTKPDEKDKV